MFVTSPRRRNTALATAVLIGVVLWWSATDPAQILQVDVSPPEKTTAIDITASEIGVFWPPDATETEVAVTGVAVGPDGSVYILHRAGRPFNADTTLIPEPVIVRVDSETQEEITHFGAGLFASPHGISVAQDGTIWVADTSLNIVVHLDQQGRPIRTYGDAYPLYMEALLRVRNLLPRLPVAKSDATFARPTDVVSLTGGRFAVSDGYRNSRLAVFDRQGTLMWQVNRRGSEPREFHLPHGIAADALGSIYVADRRNARVQVFSENGQLQRVISGSEAGRPFGVDVGPLGCIFIADGGDRLDLDEEETKNSQRAGFSVFSSRGEPILHYGATADKQNTFQLPHDIAVGPNGKVYIADLYSDRVFVVDLSTICQA
ncbi:peptidyl-alpha-hydroxyglycine alpha-amidating lyase family protein [Roseobacter sp.]|uniref:peptidyl-alpha-hydroxyglycine alpha-amidating lyase family protein n=1 Tax=Roseobacter sp. TaxID=1907202 RepID=UPI0038586120